jgi:hypothetical protein
MTLARGFMIIESNTIGGLHRFSAKRNPHHLDFVCQRRKQDECRW